MTAVEVCPICDIAGCRHIRERKAKMTHQTNEEFDALVLRLLDWPMCEWNSVIQMRKDASTAITTIRTQLAEVSHMLALSKLTTEAVLARAERAEAALAAQIEADARIAEDAWLDGVPVAEISATIRAQPHDRSALAKYREKVLQEAADELKDQGYNTAVSQILALINKENVI